MCSRMFSVGAKGYSSPYLMRPHADKSPPKPLFITEARVALMGKSILQVQKGLGEGGV